MFFDYNDSINESKQKYIKFIEYIKESNHGIYNKDPRLKNLVTLISDSIKKEFKKLNGSKFENISNILTDIEVETQTPADKDIIHLDIKWKILKDYIEPEYRNKFYKMASVVYNPIFEKCMIDILLVKSEHQSNGDFYLEVKTFIDKDLNSVLYHEVKHVLDRLDKRNKNKNIPKINTLSYENGKYQSQSKEIYNFLLTLIGEFESIKDDNPNITFSGAIKKSKWYNKILDPMKVDKRNTVKGKLVDFWIDNYGQDSLY